MEQEKNIVKRTLAKYEEQKDSWFISKGCTGERLVKHLSTSMDSITDCFKQYQFESI